MQTFLTHTQLNCNLVHFLWKVYPLTHDSLTQQLQFGKKSEIVSDSENTFICKDIQYNMLNNFDHMGCKLNI